MKSTNYQIEYYSIFLEDSSDEYFGYAIFFPDIPECTTCSNSIVSGIEMASDVLGLYLHGKNINELPPPRLPKQFVNLMTFEIPYKVIDHECIVEYNHIKKFVYFHAIAIKYPNKIDVYIAELFDLTISLNNKFESILKDYVRECIINHIHINHNICLVNEYDNYYFKCIKIKAHINVDNDGIIHTPGVIQLQ